MYARPTLRAIDAETAVASCTPCPRRYEDVYVSWEYTQVADQGFCNTLLFPDAFHFEFTSGTYVWYNMMQTY